jgi:hypothetical protein
MVLKSLLPTGVAALMSFVWPSASAQVGDTSATLQTVMLQDTLNRFDEKGNKTWYWVEYRSNGKKRSEWVYDNDKMDGLRTWYYSNGNIREMILYDHGMAGKKQEYIKPDGKMAMQENILK